MVFHLPAIGGRWSTTVMYNNHIRNVWTLRHSGAHIFQWSAIASYKM